MGSLIVKINVFFQNIKKKHWILKTLVRGSKGPKNLKSSNYKTDTKFLKKKDR